jgi:hypothetical protein
MWNKLKSALGFGEDPVIAEAKRRTLLDQADPSKRFVSGMLAISSSSGGADPAYQAEFARTAITEWYGIESPQDLAGRIQDYIDGYGETPAYDLFRAVFLARVGFGAGMLDDAGSWSWAVNAARKAQKTYSSWNAYGTAYLEGHLAYRKSEGDDPERLQEIRQSLSEVIAELSRGIWGETPWNTPL